MHGLARCARERQVPRRHAARRRPQIPAHKVVLVGLPPYLDGLLTSGLAESTVTGHEMAVGDESTDGRVSRRSRT